MCQLAAVIVDIGVFSQYQSWIHSEYPNNLRCTGNHFAMAIVEVYPIAIHNFDFDVLVQNVRI